MLKLIMLIMAFLMDIPELDTGLDTTFPLAKEIGDYRDTLHNPKAGTRATQHHMSLDPHPLVEILLLLCDEEDREGGHCTKNYPDLSTVLESPIKIVSTKSMMYLRNSLKVFKSQGKNPSSFIHFSNFNIAGYDIGGF